MMIPISFEPSATSTNPKLPPGLAKISHDEFVLIELQGSLEVECNHISERDGKLVGKLRIDEAISKPTLLIGHHLLEGKVATLPKPFAILLRSAPSLARDARQNVGTEDDEAMDGDLVPEGDMDQPVSGGMAVGWDIVALVKRKIVFSKRPMPIVGRQD